MLRFSMPFLLLAALTWSVRPANTQDLPTGKDCRAGMTYDQCLATCMELGGKGKKSKHPQNTCPKHCAKKGCK
jgi:hypothetical protein